MVNGTVKWFNESKGFGFLSQENGDDVFVHHTSIAGQRVQDVGRRSGGNIRRGVKPERTPRGQRDGRLSHITNGMRKAPDSSGPFFSPCDSRKVTRDRKFPRAAMSNQPRRMVTKGDLTKMRRADERRPDFVRADHGNDIEVPSPAGRRQCPFLQIDKRGLSGRENNPSPVQPPLHAGKNGNTDDGGAALHARHEPPPACLRTPRPVEETPSHKWHLPRPRGIRRTATPTAEKGRLIKF